MSIDARERLLREYDRLEDAIEDAAFQPHWELADWLVDNVPNGGPGRPKNVSRSTITLAEVASRRGRDRSWLQRMRQGAEATRPDRLPDVSLRTYLEALTKTNWDLAKANKALETKGKRLRDQSGPMESITAIEEQLSKRSATERAQLAAELLSDDKVVKALDNEDLSVQNRIHSASSKLINMDVDRADDRERVERGLTDDERRWEKFQRHVRSGEFGAAERQETKFEVTDERAEWLTAQAERLEFHAQWLRAIAAHEPVTDEMLERLLGGK